MRRVWIMCVALASTLEGQSGAPTIAPKLTIGCESCGGANQFGSIWDVSINAAGEVLVTDRDAPMLRRFDPTGKPTWTGGAKGKGPGEYQLPIRAAFSGPGMVVVDMTNARVTELTGAGAIRTSFTATAMPMAASVNARGDLWVGTDNFRGTLQLYRRAGDSLVAQHTITGSAMNVAIAVGPDGSLAIMPDTKKYALLRFDGRGVKLTPIVRDIPQVRRTPAEEAEVRARSNRARGMVAAESRAQGARSESPPVFRPEELSLKDHLVIDGLRFDPSGRLWVRTQRGNESSTVFDVFGAGGSLLGSVTVPMKITSYSLGGAFLVTAGENDDGIPVVSVWQVK